MAKATAPTPAPTPAPATPPWWQVAGLKIVKAFFTAFIPIVGAAGVGWLNVGTLKAASIAGLVAAAATVDSLLGNTINPGSSSTLAAIKAALSS